MARSYLAMLAVAMVLVCENAHAQCRSGGGQMSEGSASAGLAAAGTPAATLFTGPGSLAYDMRAAQMLQQQVMQQRYMLAMQQQAERQQQLAARRERAEKSRSQIAANRQRMYAYLASKYGGSKVPAPSSYVAAYLPAGK